VPSQQHQQLRALISEPVPHAQFEAKADWKLSCSAATANAAEGECDAGDNTREKQWLCCCRVTLRAAHAGQIAFSRHRVNVVGCDSSQCGGRDVISMHIYRVLWGFFQKFSSTCVVTKKKVMAGRIVMESKASHGMLHLAPHHEACMSQPLCTNFAVEAHIQCTALSMPRSEAGSCDVI
jgi:hypothetical protein